MGTMEKMDSTKHEIESKAGDVISLILRGIEAAAGVGSLVRYFNGGARGWMPFRRRRSVWGTIGLVGAGVAVGAGVSLLISPMSGQDIRQGLLKGFQKAGRKGKEMIDAAEEEIEGLAKGDDGNKQMQQGNKGEQASGKERETGTKEQREAGGKEQPGNKEQRETGMKEQLGTGNKGEHRPGNATSGAMGSGRLG